jgi:hypothetical protein
MVPPAEESVQSTVRLIPDRPATDQGSTTTYLKSLAASFIGDTLGVPHALGKSGQRITDRILESVGAREPSDSSEDESLLPDLYSETSRLSAQHKHDWALRRRVAERLLTITRDIRVHTNDKDYTVETDITDPKLYDLIVKQTKQMGFYESLAPTHDPRIKTPLSVRGEYGSSRHNIGLEAHCVAVLSHVHFTSAHQIDKETCAIFEEATRYSGQEDCGDEKTMAGDEKTLAEETLLGDMESQMENDGDDGKCAHNKM